MINKHPAGRHLMCAILLSMVVLVLAGCQSAQKRGGNGEPLIDDPAAMLQGVELGSDQVLLVLGEGAGSTDARLYALERRGRTWILRFGPVASSVGRNGFAPPGEKQEGDGRSPSGLFPLESVFGYAPTWATKMPYRQATEGDLWVDDPNAPDYNTWVRRGETAAASFEEMKLSDNRYRHGIVIGYNRNPIVKGRGSAIFLHVWLKAGYPTAGCVALEEQQLIRIIEWLDPAKKPKVLMGTLSYFSGLTGLASWRLHELQAPTRETD